MRIEKSTYTPESTGKPVPRVDVFMKTSEVADTMLNFCENPISGTNYYLDLKANNPDEWATGGRPELTHTEAIAELKAMRSQYWEDKRKHALLQADLDTGSTATEYTLSETGLFFDVARVIEGQPECWINETEAEQRRMVLRINYFVHHEVTADQLFTAIEGVVNTYKTLIKSGFQVKVEVCFQSMRQSYGGTPIAVTMFHIAACDFNEFLDEATLTYLVSPTFYRLFIIAAPDHFCKSYNGTTFGEMKQFMRASPIKYKTGEVDFWGIICGKKQPSNLHHYTLDNIQKVIEAGPQPG
jgi:hypothetical protein